MRFIKRSHRASSYERPHVEWECGSRCSGTTCPLGPSVKGECRATCECSPRLIGGSWTCTRSEENGGPCEEGPNVDGTCSKPLPPCVPRRTARSLRRRICFRAVGITLGLILLFGSGRYSKTLFSPGEVSRAHGNIGDDCASCHSAGSDGLGGWMHRFLFSDEAPNDSDKCLSCHPMGDSPLTAHNRSSAELEAVRATWDAEGGAIPQAPLALRVAAAALDISSTNEGVLDCMLCHKEHQGRLSNISELDDRRCQTCHSRQFTSLAEGHPEFSAYPHRKKTPIIFDHTSHLTKHMPEQGKEITSCKSCHQIDQKGMLMLSSSFETGCAECHHDEIRGEGAAEVGIAFLTLPEVDIETLRSKGIPVGVWPEDADGELTPIQSMIIGQMGVDIAILSGLDLYDLSEATPEQLRVAQQVVWLTKKLFYDLATRGQSAMIETLSGFTDDEQAVSLVAGLPPGLLHQALAGWMPGIRDEMKDAVVKDSKTLDAFLQSFSSGKAGASKGGRGAVTSVRDTGVLEEELVSAGGWYLDGFTLFYRPQGHQDSFVKNWIDLSSTAPKQGLARTLFKSLTAESAPGRCGYCHSVAQTEAGIAVLQWYSFRPETAARAITDFVHRPHQIKGSDEECQACHKRDSDAEYLSNYEEDSTATPRTWVSGFKNIEKATCTECHVSGKAPIACLSCHNYHVTDLGSAAHEQMTKGSPNN